MKTKVTTTTLLLASMLSVAILVTEPMSWVRAEETGDTPPFVDEVGTYFEITNSPYLNITLTSTKTVHVLLESVPRVVRFFVESNESETTTDLVITGFEPNTTYHRYQEGYLIEDFTTDSSGGYTYTQDTSEHHHVFIQEEELTIYLYEDYTFTHDIYETIVVCADNIVIDGNGYTLQGPGYGYGFYLFGRSGVTIRNVVINGWTFAISLIDGCVGNTLSMNHMVDNWYAVVLRLHCDSNTISMNTITGSYYGIHLYGYCSDNTISGNTISNNLYGIELWMYSTGCTIYHNIIIYNAYQAFDAYPAYTDWHHPDLLEGNYWSDYPGVDDGSGTGKHGIAGDGIGDTHIPWPGPDYDYYPLMQADAQPLIQNEILVIELWHLDHGVETCLTSKLESAIRLLENGNINGAIRKLQDLIKQVTNDATHLTQEQKNYIIETTQQIIDLIG